jgi:hypothetical protein
MDDRTEFAGRQVGVKNFDYVPSTENASKTLPEALP